MQVANVVDDHSEGEGPLVLLIRELLSDLACVGRLGGGDLTLKESPEGNQGFNNVDIGPVEGEVAQTGVWLVQVRRVDEVPVGLEGVALALDVVGKGGAFTEGVIALV